MESHGLHHVPREHDAAPTKPGNIVYFCKSRDHGRVLAQTETIATAALQLGGRYNVCT